MRKGKPLTVRVFVPQPDGSYKRWEELSDEDRKEFSRKCVERMAEVFNNTQHPEAYAHL